MGVAPKSSILVAFSLINHPFWGNYPHLRKPPYDLFKHMGKGWQRSTTVFFPNGMVFGPKEVVWVHKYANVNLYPTYPDLLP